MLGIIVKMGFAIIMAFCQICLFKNSVITILKVAGCEDCVRENKFPLRGPGQFLQFFFSEKNNHFNAIWMHFEHFRHFEDDDVLNILTCIGA